MLATVSALPAARITLSSEDDLTAAGALHVHSSRSDGRSTPDEIAAIAARAGIRFVVFADHGDATRPPDPPAYRHGVLCLDGVEISTNNGHYVAFDMPASPFPLAGDARDVVEDVRRLGGIGIAAHPDSPKADLRWSDWNLPIDGVEILNPDTGWRVHLEGPGWRSKWRLAEALLAYPIRPAEAIARLLVSSPALSARVQAMSEQRPVVAVAGVDAHANLEVFGSDSGDGRYALPIPRYEASLRALQVRVRPMRPLGGDADADARAIVDAVRAGRVYTVVDGLAGPPFFEFTASTASGAFEQGSELPSGGPIALRVASNAPPGFTTTIWKGSDVLESRSGEREIVVRVPR